MEKMLNKVLSIYYRVKIFILRIKITRVNARKINLVKENERLRREIDKYDVR